MKKEKVKVLNLRDKELEFPQQLTAQIVYEDLAKIFRHRVNLDSYGLRIPSAEIIQSVVMIDVIKSNVCIIQCQKATGITRLTFVSVFHYEIVELENLLYSLPVIEVTHITLWLVIRSNLSINNTKLFPQQC